MLHFNDKRLSPEANRLLHQEFGFRTDQQSEDITDVTNHQILDHEINELGNEDIPDTLNKLYGTNFKPNSDGKYDINPIFNFISKELDYQNFELIWLTADWQACIELYSDGHKDPADPWDYDKNYTQPEIDTYFVKPAYIDVDPKSKTLLVSDLGYDGELFAFTNDGIKFIHQFNN